MAKLKAVEKVFPIGDDDFAYAFCKLLEPVVAQFLKAYRDLKERRRATEKLLSDLKSRRSSTLQRIEYLTRLIPELEARQGVIGFVTFLFFIFTLVLVAAGESISFLTFIFLLASLIYTIKVRADLDEARKQLPELQVSLKQIDVAIKNAEGELERLKREIGSFTLPRIKVRAYRCFIPVAIVRNPLGGKLIVVTPWSSGETFRITYVANPSAIEEARGKLTLGENLYLDAALRGKDAGYKVVESFRKMNLWERIMESRSPERVLREIVEESYRILKSGMETGEEALKLEKLDKGSLELLSELFSRADGAVPAPVHADSMAVIESEREKLDYLVEAVRQLGGVRSYVEDVQEFMSRREIYANIVDLAVREVLAKTLPLEPDTTNFFFGTAYCKFCAERLIEDYLSQIDLRKWVYSEILGGVDRDPDILFPDELTRDIVEEVWKKLEEKVYRELPLPGVSGEEPLEELKTKYAEALKEYALVFTGADERVEMRWVSAYQPPTIRCARCGRQIDLSSTYLVANLKLPLIKGYIGLLAEKQRELLERSKEIVTSVNAARLHKDERKTAIGIYGQMVQSIEQEVSRIEKEKTEAEAHRRNLLKVLGPLIATSAAQEIVKALPELEILRSQLETTATVVGDKL